MLRLPVAMAGYARRQQGEGQQLYGYGKHDLPLLASYSRSGTNWVRYGIEWISGRPTPGQVRLHVGNDFVIDRAHCAYPIMDTHPRVLLVLRDYRECLLRHLPDHWARVENIEDFLEERGEFQEPRWYIKNLEAFDSFEGPRLLVYYEDLMERPAEAFESISEFLSLPSERLAAFNANIEQRFFESVNSYTFTGHESISSASKDTAHHARTLLSDRQRAEFDEYYRTRFPVLFDRYLGRYAT